MTNEGSSIDEATRIRDAYARQGPRWQQKQYRGWMPGTLFMAQEQERVMLDLLHRHGAFPLSDKRILDVGCGVGKTLLRFLQYGARPGNLFGVDLLEDGINVARELAPHLHFEVRDARQLPFEDETMDLVLGFTLFSAIQSSSIREAVAGEMLRVLRRSGAVLVYDFWTTGRVNPDNRPLRRREMKRLFPGCHVQARRVTLAPPLARRLAPRSWFVCELLVRAPFLRTHWLALITREA
jgi:SAM-dependent methyltransferase